MLGSAKIVAFAATTDIARSTAFYRDKLGVKHLFTVPKMAFFDCGGIRLMLAVPEGPPAGYNQLATTGQDARRQR